VSLTLDARPGNNRVRFLVDTVERPSKQNPIPRAFVVISPTISRK